MFFTHRQKNICKLFCSFFSQSWILDPLLGCGEMAYDNGHRQQDRRMSRKSFSKKGFFKWLLWAAMRGRKGVISRWQFHFFFSSICLNLEVCTRYNGVDTDAEVSNHTRDDCFGLDYRFSIIYEKTHSLVFNSQPTCGFWNIQHDFRCFFTLNLSLMKKM